MTTKIKLSEKQKEVVGLMLKGWECAKYYGLGVDLRWLQEDGVGCGGKSFRINKNTFSSLVRSKIIEFHKKEMGNSIFVLTTFGKSLPL